MICIGQSKLCTREGIHPVAADQSRVGRGLLDRNRSGRRPLHTKSHRRILCAIAKPNILLVLKLQKHSVEV